MAAQQGGPAPAPAASPASAPAPAAQPLTPTQIVAAAPAADWVAIEPEDLMVMDLAPDAAGAPRRVIIQLIAGAYSHDWVENIRELARAHWWDGTSVNRVQDNYVAQWGDPDGDDKARAKPLPPGLAKVSGRAYTLPAFATPDFVNPAPDAYAPHTGVDMGFPVGFDASRIWPVHCYGSVGVGRNLAPDTGTGAELYAAIGPARPLDRNIAVVGRVIEGMAHLSALPRGNGALGVYADARQRVAIRSVRLASDMAPADRPRFEYLKPVSQTFARYARARANRRDAFFIQPAGGADICNLPDPVRRIPAKR